MTKRTHRHDARCPHCKAKLSSAVTPREKAHKAKIRFIKVALRNTAIGLLLGAFAWLVLINILNLG